MARAAKKETSLTTEEKLAKALVPEEEQPYPVPENWCWVRFHDLCSEIQYGYTAKSIKDDTLPKMLRITDMQDGFVNWNDVPNCQISENEFKKYQLAEGDIVFARTGATTGKSYLLTHPPDSVYASYLIRVRLSSFINRKYSYYFLQTSYYWNYITEVSAGIAQPGCNAKKLGKLPFPLPPLPEQQRIVTLIESLFADLDAAKEKLQAVLDGFAMRRAALLHQAFTGELTREWREEQGVGFESWDDLSFDDCVDKMQNGLSKRKGSSGENYAVLRLADIGEDGISMDDLRYILLNDKEQEKYALCDGDVLMVRVNGSRDNVGRQIYVNNPSRLAFCDHLIRIRYKTQCFARYMCLITHTNKYRQYIKEHMVSTAGQNTISRRGMQAFNVKLPTLPEQKEIVRILDDIFSKESQSKAAVESVLSEIDTMKKAILATAFRGGFETSDSSDENAEKLLRRVL